MQNKRGVFERRKMTSMNAGLPKLFKKIFDKIMTTNYVATTSLGSYTPWVNLHPLGELTPMLVRKQEVNKNLPLFLTLLIRKLVSM
jgi:hypothetical protein